MAYYLAYDAGCQTCSKIGETIARIAGPRLELVDLESPEAKMLLDRALPKGWKFIPHLLKAAARDDSQVRAWSGVAATMRLGVLLGPWRALKLLGTIGPIPTLKGVPSLEGRRRWLRQASALSLWAAAVITGFSGSAYAQCVCQLWGTCTYITSGCFNCYPTCTGNCCCDEYYCTCGDPCEAPGSCIGCDALVITDWCDNCEDC